MSANRTPLPTPGENFMAVGEPEQELSVDQVGDVETPDQWWQVLWSSKKARIGIIILAVYVLVAIFAPLIAPHDPLDGSFEPLAPASSTNWLGTTTSGQDIASQLIYGTRISLLVGLFGGLFATVIATVIGLTSGYAEGTLLDDLLSFLTNVFLVIPVFPLIITLVAYSEVRGLWLIVGVVSITSWAGAARAKRAQIITLRNRDFVTAAKFSGEGTGRIVFREIMPNMSSLVLASFVGAATGAIFAEAGLAALGLGDSRNVSWGTMLYQSEQQGALSQGLWLWVFAPGVVLAVLMTATTFINFGVDLLSNPHLREDA